MNSTNSASKNKIKRRSFFYYIGAAALGAAVLAKFPFSLFGKKTISSGHRASIKVTENPYAVKRTAKDPLNG